MNTSDISLRDGGAASADEAVAGGSFGAGSESARDLNCDDEDRQLLRGLLLAGASSKPTAPLDGAYFDRLRARVLSLTAG